MKYRSYGHKIFFNTFSEGCNRSSKASLASRVRNSSIDGNRDNYKSQIFRCISSAGETKAEKG